MAFKHNLSYSFFSLLSLFCFLTMASMGLNILSWNVRGIMSSAYSLSCILDENNIDIALISEHKLFSYSAGFLSSINTKYDYVSVEQSGTNPYSKATCGQGGVAILYKKSLSKQTEHIDHIRNDRILGIELKPINNQQESLFVFSVYLPAHNNISDYKDTVSELEAISSFYLKEGNLIVGGDCNTQILNIHNGHNGSSYKSKILNNFIDSMNLISINTANLRTGPNYSFCPNKTMLDHIFVNEGYFNGVSKCYIIAEDKILTSDHLPIVIKFTANFPGDYAAPEFKQVQEKCIAWHKITNHHIEHYQSQLSSILADKLTPEEINHENISQIVTNAMHLAADKTLPKSVKEAHTSSRNLRQRLINENRPRGDIISLI